MAGVRGTRVDIDADEFVLVAVVPIRLSSLLFGFPLPGKLLLGGLVAADIAELGGLFSSLLLCKTILSAHHVVERVGLQVEHVGEGAVRVDLVFLEGIEVEADPLQVYDEDVWSRSDHGTPLQVDLSVASIALIVTDDLTFDLLLNSLFYGFDALDGH